MTTSMKWVQDYFICHLEREKWNRFSLEYRLAAVAMAEEDVMHELNLTELDPTDRLLLCAIAEQALYLADNHDRARRAAARNTGELKSEDIEGLGSRSYYRKTTEAPEPGKLPPLAPRTEFFLAKYPGYRATRFQRG